MMIRLRLCFLLVCFAIFIVGCASVDVAQLDGDWIGIEVLEEGEPLEIKPSDIRFIFDTESKGYQYFSTLNYKEAGTYHLDSKFLYTLDTINQASRERSVEILQMSGDSLVLRMMEEGKERVLKLILADK